MLKATLSLCFHLASSQLYLANRSPSDSLALAV